MYAKKYLFGLLTASVCVAQPPVPQPPVNVPAAPPGVIAPAFQPPVVQGPPVQIVPAPVVPGVPVLPGPTALTLAQAERALKCLPPGCHHLMFIHPVTCCPVAVTVRICGCVTDVKASKCLGTHKLTFKIKGWNNDVVVKFKPNGSAVVVD